MKWSWKQRILLKYKIIQEHLFARKPLKNVCFKLDNCEWNKNKNKKIAEKFYQLNVIINQITWTRTLYSIAKY